MYAKNFKHVAGVAGFSSSMITSIVGLNADVSFTIVCCGCDLTEMSESETLIWLNSSSW